MNGDLVVAFIDSCAAVVPPQWEEALTACLAAAQHESSMGGVSDTLPPNRITALARCLSLASQWEAAMAAVSLASPQLTLCGAQLIRKNSRLMAPESTASYVRACGYSLRACPTAGAALACLGSLLQRTESVVSEAVSPVDSADSAFLRDSVLGAASKVGFSSAVSQVDRSRAWSHALEILSLVPCEPANGLGDDASKFIRAFRIGDPDWPSADGHDIGASISPRGNGNEDHSDANRTIRFQNARHRNSFMSKVTREGKWRDAIRCYHATSSMGSGESATVGFNLALKAGTLGPWKDRPTVQRAAVRRFIRNGVVRGSVEPNRGTVKAVAEACATTGEWWLATQVLSLPPWTDHLTASAVRPLLLAVVGEGKWRLALQWLSSESTASVAASYRNVDLSSVVARAMCRAVAARHLVDVGHVWKRAVQLVQEPLSDQRWSEEHAKAARLAAVALRQGGFWEAGLEVVARTPPADRSGVARTLLDRNFAMPGDVAKLVKVRHLE